MLSEYTGIIFCYLNLEFNVNFTYKLFFKNSPDYFSIFSIFQLKFLNNNSRNATQIEFSEHLTNNNTLTRDPDFIVFVCLDVN